MHRGSAILLVLACCLTALPQARPAEPAGDLQQALALQKAMQRVIAQAEPSIACILVSRSDAYQRVAQEPLPETPGRLGGFDPNFIRNPRLSIEDKLTWRKKLDLSDPGHVPQSFGSGVVIDASGLIATHYHVVEDATKIFVRLPGGKASYADIHAADPRSDFAVLRLLNPKMLPLMPIAFGNADVMERGQFVLSIANPFAVGFRDGQPSASWGILSNMRRRSVNQLREEDRTKPLHYYGTLLQTDARLQLGCSGGALVNLQGELVGLTTALAAIQGGESPAGFALPINAGSRRILEVLKRGEEVDYGFLGVTFKESTMEPSTGTPQRGSPADLEGHLQLDDVIVAIDGVPIHDTNDLFVNLGTHLAGDKIKLRYRRPSTRELVTVEITLAKLHVSGKKIASSLGNRPFVRGLRVDYASLAVQPQLRLSRIPAGVLITEVQTDSPAERARLKPGETVTHVNGTAVTTPDAFYQAIARQILPIELTLHNFSLQDPPNKVLLK